MAHRPYADPHAAVRNKNIVLVADFAAPHQAAEVALSGRTLYKDGSWNTLCLPFNVTLSGNP